MSLDMHCMLMTILLVEANQIGSSKGVVGVDDATPRGTSGLRQCPPFGQPVLTCKATGTLVKWFLPTEIGFHVGYSQLA